MAGVEDDVAALLEVNVNGRALREPEREPTIRPSKAVALLRTPEREPEAPEPEPEASAICTKRVY